MMLQCLGGWYAGKACSSRELCAHYFAPKIPGREPVERLCGELEEPEAWYKSRLIQVSRSSKLPTNPVADIPAPDGGGSAQSATAAD